VRHKKQGATFARNPLMYLVGGARFELATNGLKVLMLRNALLPFKNLADRKNGVLRHVQSQNQIFSHQRPVTGG
jgi:hypothetical protein